MLRASHHCVVFTGAGISTAAGIGDYRGITGKWTLSDLNELISDCELKADTFLYHLCNRDALG